MDKVVNKFLHVGCNGLISRSVPLLILLWILGMQKVQAVLARIEKKEMCERGMRDRTVMKTRWGICFSLCGIMMVYNNALTIGNMKGRGGTYRHSTAFEVYFYNIYPRFGLILLHSLMAGMILSSISSSLILQRCV